MSDRVEVLIAALDCNPESLIDKMNIQTDAIVANQCDENRIYDFNANEHCIKVLNFNERGVGLNRNNALMRATAEYCLIADDDMVYLDGYEEIVLRAFKENPNADVIFFNLEEPIPHRFINKKKFTVGFFNFMRYGAARMAIRLDSIRTNGVFFNLCFGGGTDHSHGEDTLFLADCLKKKLRIIAVPDYIACLTEERESTWEQGKNEKYLRDQSLLFSLIDSRKWKLLCLQDVIRHGNEFTVSRLKALKIMLNNGRSM